MDVDLRSVGDHPVDLFDMPIFDGDAPHGPIAAQTAVSACAAMDKDIAARTFPL